VEANDTGWTLHADVPGVSAEALELTVLGRELQLFVEADTKLPEGFQLRRQERQPSRIERTIRLPNTVDTDALQARLVDGVLQITLPRRAEDAPRRITVHS
jgi:HSP20 family protein